MTNHLEEQNKFLINNSFSGQFPAIIGILSVLSYPIFLLVWGMEPIDVNKYLELIAVFGSLFFLMLYIGYRWVDTFRVFSALYVNLVMPSFCLLASLAMAGVLSTEGYGTALIALHIVFALLLLMARKYSQQAPLFNQPDRIILGFLPLGYGSIFWIWICKTYDLFRTGFWTAWIMIPIVMFLVLFCLWLLDLWLDRSQSKHRWVVRLLAVLLLVGLVYRPELFVDRHHYNFFMAPLNDVIHDKVLFVNATSQYGFGVIYALAIMFRALHLPVGYEGFSFIIVMLFMLQYLILAVMLWEATDNLLLGIAGMLVIIYFNYLSVFWPSMLRTPAQSPLRYGLVYLLLYTALISTKTSSRYLRIMEFVFLGVASIWSLETFIYAILSVDAFYFVKDVLFVPQFQSGLKVFAKRLAYQAGTVLVCWGVLLIFTRVASGQFPNMRMYLEYFQAYSVIPYDGGPIAPHIFRTGAVMFVYLSSIFAVFVNRFQRLNFLSPSIASMLAVMSVAGILQYFYYFVYYIDFHLALLSVPLIFVLALWVEAVRRCSSMSFLFRANMIAVLLVSLMATMIVTAPGFYNKFSKSLLFVPLAREQGTFSTNPWQALPSGRSAELLVYLIQKYSGGDQQIAIFVAPDVQTEVLFLTGKTDLLGMSAPEMSSISPTYSEYVLRQAKAIAGQPRYIYYDIEENSLGRLQQEAYQVLIESTEYKIIDKRSNFVVLKKVH